jgi:hypothetical protein
MEIDLGASLSRRLSTPEQGVTTRAGRHPTDAQFQQKSTAAGVAHKKGNPSPFDRANSKVSRGAAQAGKGGGEGGTKPTIVAPRPLVKSKAGRLAKPPRRFDPNLGGKVSQMELTPLEKAELSQKEALTLTLECEQCRIDASNAKRREIWAQNAKRPSFAKKGAHAKKGHEPFCPRSRQYKRLQLEKAIALAQEKERAVKLKALEKERKEARQLAKSIALAQEKERAAKFEALEKERREARIKAKSARKKQRADTKAKKREADLHDWLGEDDLLLHSLVNRYGSKNWGKFPAHFKGKSWQTIKRRWDYCVEAGSKDGKEEVVAGRYSNAKPAAAGPPSKLGPSIIPPCEGNVATSGLHWRDGMVILVPPPPKTTPSPPPSSPTSLPAPLPPTLKSPAETAVPVFKDKDSPEEEEPPKKRPYKLKCRACLDNGIVDSTHRKGTSSCPFNGGRREKSESQDGRRKSESQGGGVALLVASAGTKRSRSEMEEAVSRGDDDGGGQRGRNGDEGPAHDGEVEFMEELSTVAIDRRMMTDVQLHQRWDIVRVHAPDPPEEYCLVPFCAVCGGGSEGTFEDSPPPPALLVIEARRDAPSAQSERDRVCAQCLLFRISPLSPHGNRVEGYRLHQHPEVAMHVGTFDINVFPLPVYAKAHMEGEVASRPDGSFELLTSASCETIGKGRGARAWVNPDHPSRALGIAGTDVDLESLITAVDNEGRWVRMQLVGYDARKRTFLVRCSLQGGDAGATAAPTTVEFRARLSSFTARLPQTAADKAVPLPTRQQVEHAREGPDDRLDLFTPEEDAKVMHHVKRYGPQKWDALVLALRKSRKGNSADDTSNRSLAAWRDRWTNHLDPGISRAPWSRREDDLILLIHGKMSNHWGEISGVLLQHTGLYRPAAKVRERCDELYQLEIAERHLERGKKGTKKQKKPNDCSEGDVSTIISRPPALSPTPALETTEIVVPGQYIGREIKKDFGCAPYPNVFSGQVSSFDREERTGRILYRVAYEDGDEEDLYQEEVAGILLPLAPV